jgi:DNA recombination protein RmuC
MQDFSPWIIAFLAVAALVLFFGLGVWVARLAATSRRLHDGLDTLLEARHRAMLTDLHEGLARQAQRIAIAQSDAADRLRAAVVAELAASRETIQTLRETQAENLAASREALIEQLAALRQILAEKQDALKAEMLSATLQKIAEQSRADQELIQNTLRNITAQVNTTIEALTKTIDGRLLEIGGKVSERLDEGFKRTNETFANVMARLATIDEAQKKIDGLTSNVVSLQQLLGDKRSRGAFGEVQLEALVANVMPPGSYALQHVFPGGTRVDCALFLPAPTGTVAVDSKFPLENYQRLFEEGGDSALAARAFAQDVKKHVDDIAAKYIIADVTSDGAVMFVPAEAVFAEIHARHAGIVEYANRKRVWIVSPTTLMAVLNTARAVMKDVETRKQVHIIKNELGKLATDFARFDERMKKLAEHIRLANKDVEDVHISSKKISERFNKIERVELEQPSTPQLRLIDGE